MNEQSITKVIKERTSIRTYDNRQLDKSSINELNEFIKNIKGPFSSKVRFKFINSQGDINGAKLGTYGIIKGASDFIGVAVEKGDRDLEELGYEMESLVLYAKSIGLGTCWMAGTFKKSEFHKVMDLKENEIFAVISPIGYPSEKRGLVEKFVRFQGKCDTRKPWGELFFLEDFNNPLIEGEELGVMRQVLENVRLAPSAVNKQPWRIVKSGDKFHFFKIGKESLAEEGYKNYKMDMGIAMCHFDLSCIEFGIRGKFIKENPDINEKSEDYQYVISWIQEN